jgi:hypothetical protein
LAIAVASQNREDSKMARLVLSAYHAKREGPHVQIALMTLPRPFPDKIVEIKTAADCAAALEAYKIEAAETGTPMAIVMTMARGERKPPGFNKIRAVYAYEVVNLPGPLCLADTKL